MEPLLKNLAKARADLEELKNEMGQALLAAVSDVTARYEERRKALQQRVDFLIREVGEEDNALVQPATAVARVLEVVPAPAVVPMSETPSVTTNAAEPASAGDIILKLLAKADGNVSLGAIEKAVDDVGLSVHAARKARYLLKKKGHITANGRWFTITDAGRAKIRGQ